MTLPPTSTALLRALRDAGGALPWDDERVEPVGLTPLRHAGLVSFVDPAVHSSGVATVELTAAGRIEAARL